MQDMHYALRVLLFINDYATAVVIDTSFIALKILLLQLLCFDIPFLRAALTLTCYCASASNLNSYPFIIGPC